MKKNIVIICLIFVSINFFADDQSSFQEAQNKFAQDQWAESLFYYEAIQNKNSLVWQNIATCLFHQQKYTEALIATKRAYWGVSFKQLDYLASLEKKIDVELHIQPPSDFYFIMLKVLHCIPLILLQIIFLILLIQVFLILLRRWKWHDFTQQEKKYLKKLIICLLVSVCLWYAKTLFFFDDKAIVIQSNAMVYAGPNESFHDFEKLQQGIEVKIMKKEKNMYHIKTQTFSGWVNTDVLEPIINHE